MEYYPKPKKLVENLNRMNDKGSPRKDFIRFDKNERTTPFNKKIIEDISNKLDGDIFSIYPDQNPFYKKLSIQLNISDKKLLLTSGSDSAIKAIFETYISSGDEVGYLWPTYAMIDVYADMFGAKKVKFEYNSNLLLDVDAIINKIKDGLRMLIIANPNQPSGTIIDDLILDEIIQAAEENQTIIVLDQAYIEFSKIKGREKELDKYKFLILTRTFSKAYGLAGLRLGYIISSEHNINYIYKVKPYADINAISLMVTEYFLDNKSILNDYVKEINEAKMILSDFFAELKIEFINSHTNFVHIKIDNHLGLYHEKLQNKKYLIRKTGIGLPAVISDCLRITLGPKILINGFIQDFKEIHDKIK